MVPIALAAPLVLFRTLNTLLTMRGSRALVTKPWTPLEFTEVTVDPMRGSRALVTKPWTPLKFTEVTVDPMALALPLPASELLWARLGGKGGSSSGEVVEVGRWTVVVPTSNASERAERGLDLLFVQ